MTTYEYDEKEDKLLSVFDSLVGTYSRREDTHIFKTKAGTITFIPDPFYSGRYSIKDDEFEVTFGWYYQSQRIQGGIVIKTDIGIFRPQDMDLLKEIKAKFCTSLNSLTIRQLSEIAKKAIEQYKELIDQ